MRRTLIAFALGAALLAGTRAAHAGVCDTEDAGACSANEYCAYADGGAILDGAAGVCQPEPCVVATDCADANTPICDTSQNPFQCVECISGSDCPGVLACDVTTHTCVTPPPPPDASAGEDGAAGDAGEDATSAGEGGGPSTDAASPGDGAPSGAPDASGTADGSPGSGPPGAGEDASAEAGTGQDQGSLGGGAWDCELATPARAPFAGLGLTLALALLWFARVRARAS